jgi:hypothetical protein
VYPEIVRPPLSIGAVQLNSIEPSDFGVAVKDWGAVEVGAVVIVAVATAPAPKLLVAAIVIVYVVPLSSPVASQTEDEEPIDAH